MQRIKQTQSKKKKKGRMPTLSRLVWANAAAALVLLATTVTVLWALGLLWSVIDFFF